jgi:oligopeptide/dipeptide ABC transporter ATP-binding protein
LNEPTDAHPLLVAEHLVKRFPVRRTLTQVARRAPRQQLVALDDVSVRLHPGQVLGVVGESGSGKSTLAYCMIRLLKPDSGKVLIGDQDFHALRGEPLRDLQRRIQLIFQDPYMSLNPRLTIGRAIGEPARVHELVDKAGEEVMVGELLERCGLRRQDAARYPRQLSGGQRQRVAIARALAVKPGILIADEAVSALDVSVQAQILNLFAELQADLGVGIIFITHQLAVISHLATDVVVLYLGRVVESGPTTSVLSQSYHPYTRGLLQAQPSIRHNRVQRSPALQGEVPSPLAIPSGCRFHTRCPLAQEMCREVDPPAVEVAPGHLSRCHVLAPAGVATDVSRTGRPPSTPSTSPSTVASAPDASNTKGRSYAED